MILKCDRIHSERNYGYLINTIETNGEEMSSKVFNKKLRTVQERTEHIHNIVDEEQIRDEFFGDIQSGCLAQDSKSGHYLETIANYILESPNVESGRKINDTFYPSEKYYWSKAAIAKNLQVTSERLENYPEEDHSDYSSGGLRSLFCLDNLSQEVIRNFILLGLCSQTKRNELCSDDEELLDAINWLGQEIDESLTASDKILVSFFDGTNNVSTVANMIGVSHQNISKKIKKICKNAEKWLRNQN